MLSEEIRKRLEQVHRPLWFHPAGGATGRATIDAARSVPLEPAEAGAFYRVSQGEEIANSAGTHLRFRRPLARER
jgi:hypothetical protein